MEMRLLGATGLKVSALCLGTMTWGEQNREAEGHEQMDYAVSQGINFFDCAELYPIAPKAETQGRTEEIVGSWLKARSNRDQIILATKIAGRSPMTWFREDGSTSAVSPAQIVEAVDKSLKRLQTDYIDLYQIHWPDRPVSLFGSTPEVAEITAELVNPIEAQVEALGALVKAGKIRHIGLSNETAWGVMAFRRAAESAGLAKIQTIQNAYNFLNRTFEEALSEVCLRENVGLLAYSPLGQGYLSGKYENGALPPGSRKALFDRLQRYETPGAPAAITAYLDLAKDLGVDPAQLAQQFVTTRPFVTANIIGATTMAQLKTAIASRSLDWSDEIEQAIENIYLIHKNPCP